MFKKKKPFNSYENRVDDLIHEVWEARDSLSAKAKQVITRLGIINLYPDGADRRSISYECADDLLEKLKE